jgi:hypothetical protein
VQERGSHSVNKRNKSNEKEGEISLLCCMTFPITLANTFAVRTLDRLGRGEGQIEDYT